MKTHSTATPQDKEHMQLLTKADNVRYLVKTKAKVAIYES